MSRHLRSARPIARLLTAVALIIFAATCSESPTGPDAPTETPIVLEQLVTGSVAAGQTASYSAVAPAGAPFFIAFQARSGALADTLVAVITMAEGGAAVATVRSAGSQATLFEKLVMLPAAGTDRGLIVTISGASPTTASPFHLMARPMGNGPESSAATTTSGVTITEAIDASGDVDEFTFQGSGAHIAWIHLAAETPFADGLRVVLLDGTTELASVTTTAAQTTLGELAAGPVELPRTGTYTLRVMGGGSPSTSTGRYRLRAQSIPKAPPPTPVMLLLKDIGIDTLTATDTVSSWRLQWVAPEPSLGLTLEILEGLPTDTITATVHTAITLQEVGTFIAVKQDGVSMFEIPGVAGNRTELLVATVRSKRHGAELTYRVRFGGPTSDLPEHVSSTLIPGDTIVGDSITHVLDMDRFTFTPAVADSEWVFMLVPTEPGPELGMRLHDRDHRLVEQIAVTGQYTDLERTATFVKLAEDRGPYTVTVAGNFPAQTPFSGGYRLRVARVDRTPEGIAVPILPGDTVTSAIEQPGDIDEFRLDATEGDELYFLFDQHVPDAEQGFVVLDGQVSQQRTVLRPDDRVSLDVLRAHHRWVVPRTGAFTLRVHNGQTAGPAARWPSAYTFEVQKVNRAPEVANATGWVYGDTIRGESIERRGDVDEFEMTFAEATMTRATFIAHRSHPNDEATLTVLDANGGFVSRLELGEGSGVDTIAVLAHLEIPAAGTYTIRAEATSHAATPFSFHLVPSYIGPEAINDTLPVGSWITGEAIDSIGDYDRYVFPVQAGMRYLAEVEYVGGGTGGLQFESDVSFVRTDGPRNRGTATTTGYIRANVFGYPNASGPGVGPYRLRIHPSSPQPETAPASITIGQTVSTEGIDAHGDEDIFTFAGLAGDQLRLTALPGAHASGAQLQVIVRTADGYPVAFYWPGETMKEFDLPLSGPYEIVIVAGEMNSDRDLGSYVITLERR